MIDNRILIDNSVQQLNYTADCNFFGKHKAYTVQEVAEKIWQCYKYARRMDHTIRSGFGLCGMYPYDPNKLSDDGRPESDAEHAGGCIEIAYDLFRFYPEIFSYSTQQRIVELLRYHDLGEVAYGDKPDDGSQNLAEKDEAELKALDSYLGVFPTKQIALLREDFIMFQSPEAYHGESTSMIQFAKLCDKADAPLHGLLYKAHGHPGSLRYKEEHFGGITDSDRMFAELTGDYSLEAVWVAHFIKNYHSYRYFPLFYALIEAASRDVLGHMFEWVTTEQQEFNIPDTHLYYN